MRTARLEVLVTEDEKEQVDRLRDESGVPTSTFLRKLLLAALREQRQAKPTRPRRKLAG